MTTKHENLIEYRLSLYTGIFNTALMFFVTSFAIVGILQLPEPVEETHYHFVFGSQFYLVLLALSVIGVVISLISSSVYLKSKQPGLGRLVPFLSIGSCVASLAVMIYMGHYHTDIWWEKVFSFENLFKL